MINNFKGSHQFMDNRTQHHFDMGNVLNKLRSITQEDNEPNTMVNDDNFTKVMSRLAGIKDALSDEEFSAIRAGVRSLYMNQRPNSQQLAALMSLLETVLGYIASDNTLFQRLKSNLKKDSATDTAAEPMAAAPAAEEPPAAPGVRGLK
jgi:hypothetical protein